MQVRPRLAGSIPGSGRSPGVREWQSTPVSLPGELQGQRSLAGYSSQGHTESTWLKQLSMAQHTSTWLWHSKIFPSFFIFHNKFWISILCFKATYFILSLKLIQIKFPLPWNFPCFVNIHYFIYKFMGKGINEKVSITLISKCHFL